jgi:DNA polymerase-3 subunit delta
MTEEIRTLLTLKLGMEQGRPLGALLKEYRVWGPRERLMEPALRRLDRESLSMALQQCAQIDKMVKGLRAPACNGDPWNTLLQLGVHIAIGRELVPAPAV